MISGDCQATHTRDHVWCDGRDQVWILQGEQMTKNHHINFINVVFCVLKTLSLSPSRWTS